VNLRLALVAAIALAFPAVFAASAAMIQETTGFPAGRPLDGIFAALGVTNASPLPVRQSWFLGAYILAPLAGAAMAASAGAAGARPRWAFIATAGAGTVVAGFWVLWSLLDR
jgi:hypothetical protein